MINKSSKSLKKILAERNNDYTFVENKYSNSAGTSLLLDPFTYPLSMSSPSLSATVLIPAWNARDTILACLSAIEQSSFNLKYKDKLQVVIVDDGSTDDTWDIIKKSHFSLQVTAVRQDHKGVAQAKNTGISVAEGDIIISCDADMILGYFTIEHFMSRHQKLNNALLIGFRSEIAKDNPLVNPELIKKNNGLITTFIKDERIIFSVPGWPSNMCLVSNHFKNLGNARSLWMPDDDAWLLPDLGFGVLVSLPKSIYLSVGGYDEQFKGWGSEDGYLAAKVIGDGHHMIPVYAASGFHISHQPRSKNRQSEYLENRKLFFHLIQTSNVGEYYNWIREARNRITETFILNPVGSSNKTNDKFSSKINSEFDLNFIEGLLAIGDYEKVLKNLEKQSVRVNEEQKLLMLGKAYLGMSQYEKAISIFNEISSSDNFESEKVIQLAISLAANDQFILAKSTLKKLTEKNPKKSNLDYWYYGSVRKHIDQGKKYFKQEFYKVALRCFEAALILDSKNPIALKYRKETMAKIW